MSVQIQFDRESLRPLVAEIVSEILSQVRLDAGPFGDRLAVSEAEGARLLGLRQHQLRDCRLRGEIESSRGPGGRVLYSKKNLLAYLARRK
jgi:hypothetical protein